MVKNLIGIGTALLANFRKTVQIIFRFALVSFMIPVFFVACSVNTPPSDLLGVWKTSAENYNDRSIEITPDSLIFGVGEGQQLVHAISDISSEQEEGGMRYAFRYLDQEGEEWTLSLLYNSRDGGTIVLQNRDEVWMKEELL